MISVSRVPEVATTAVSGPGAAKQTHTQSFKSAHTFEGETTTTTTTLNCIKLRKFSFIKKQHKRNLTTQRVSLKIMFKEIQSKIQSVPNSTVRIS